MNRTEVINRIEFLRNAIGYSRDKEKIMTLGEGIVCNQEVASLFKLLDKALYHYVYPEYTIPNELEKKVIKCNDLIKIENWEKEPVGIL